MIVINSYITWYRLNDIRASEKFPLISPEGERIMDHWTAPLKYGAENYIFKENIKNSKFAQFTLYVAIKSTNRTKHLSLAEKQLNICSKTTTISYKSKFKKRNLKIEPLKWLETAIKTNKERGC